jgi:hypothetical protein
LFHCRVHHVFAERFPEGEASEAELRRRIHRLGQVEFDEVRRVLRQEGFLLPPDDRRTVYGEFAAAYLELRYFAAALLPHYFPALEDFERIDALLAEDMDANAIYHRTRPAGAPDPVITAVSAALASAHDVEVIPSAEAGRGEDPQAGQRYLAKADKARGRGNVVRSAILRERASRVGGPALAREAQEAAAADLEALCARLGGALDLSAAQEGQWREALPPLLEQAATGTWAVEGRLLYDLQKVCVDHERGVYELDPVAWAFSLGKKPLKCPLPLQREVRIVHHLRKAARRVAKVRLADLDRQRLAALLESAIDDSEERLRQRFRPLLQDALAKVGMKPENFPERVALQKLVEELLDRITEYGYLSIGDLRDALSRNNLKLPDLAGPGEFFRGDRLLLLDRELAAALTGVYRGGEFYMRGLQRFSALAFGTRLGRFLTRYIALPFGGAFVILMGLYAGGEEVIKLFQVGDKKRWEQLNIANPVSITLLGVFLFGLIHVPPFRRAVATAFRWLFRGFRAVLFDAPRALLRLPWMRKVLQSPPVALFTTYLLTPLVLTALASVIFPLSGSEPSTALGGGVAIFLAAVLLCNTRFGRDAQEAVTDLLIRNWEYLRSDLIPGLFRAVVDFFKMILELVERFLYTVDEWLRFKSDEGRLSLGIKCALAPVWYLLTYLIRFAINLLIEPQINPIKHFPVVTVSHKLLIPTYPMLAEILQSAMDIPHSSAIGIATAIIWCIPGIFGFLVWELKENWKLYRANRSPTLKPVGIGHHGETMLRLMKPGFHSGTLPKLFAKLRKAERRAPRRRNWRTVFKQLAALHHVEESLRHFVERELVALLHQSKGWEGAPVAAGEIVLASDRIRVELCRPEGGGESLELSFEDQSGWLVAGVSRPGWLGELSGPQEQVLRTALAGFYKMAGVALVREQVASCFEPAAVAYEVTGVGLVVWPGDDFRREAVYDLTMGEIIKPRPRSDAAAEALPTLKAVQLEFALTSVTWNEWVRAWEQDQLGKNQVPELAPGIRLLPLRGEALGIRH